MASVVEIQRLRPLLVLKILEQSSDQLIAWLAERKIDLMIGRYTDEAQRSQFHYQRLSAEPLYVVGGLHHPLRGAADLALTEPGPLAVDFVPRLHGRTQGVRRPVWRRGPGADGRRGGNAVLLVCAGTDEHHQHDVAAACASGGEIREQGPAVAHPLDLPDRMPSYGLITRLGEEPTPSAQAFMDVLRETAGVAPEAT